MPAPFSYAVNYLMSTDKPPKKLKPVTVYSILVGALGIRSNCDIKLNIPIYKGEDKGFDYALHVASAFDNLNLNPITKQYNFSFDLLNST